MPSPRIFRTLSVAVAVLVSAGNAAAAGDAAGSAPLDISGVYPHLAFYNNEGECGTGAVVPWAGSLWAITYAPHEPFGSSDKLYQITPPPELRRVVRKESTGGTPANRLVHRESNQLFIGNYAINATGGVRVIPHTEMPGRLTGSARHLTAPADKIYHATMEAGFYEVDVHSLAIKTLYRDRNLDRRRGKKGAPAAAPAPASPAASAPLANISGAHGKGLYSGQGVLVFSNNGENTPAALKRPDVTAGALAEWDGREWRVVRRNQFTEITGPGGILGTAGDDKNAPIWALGWDHKSVLLGVREPTVEKASPWRFFRLPKASNSYDGAHGWNTEWPRIRNVAAAGEPPFYLMTMHGMFWRLPKTFSHRSTGGVRPLAAYLKVIGDFARWNDKIVLGCDDSAKNEFLNKRRAKGGVGGPGKSNSNLWFCDTSTLSSLGPNTAAGAVWLREDVAANTPSEPFLFAGWDKRAAWLKNNGTGSVVFHFERDENGDNKWTRFRSENVAAGGAKFVVFANENDAVEWVRVTCDKDTSASVTFVFSQNEKRAAKPDAIFDGLSLIGDEANGTKNRTAGGIVYARGNDAGTLGLLTDGGAFYEATATRETLQLAPPAGGENVAKKAAAFAAKKYALAGAKETGVSVDARSVLVVDDAGRRWRLPLGDARFSKPTNAGALRVCREVATERDLFHCHGTFYELPAENAGGFAKIRPIASHNFRIQDYCSWRGLLILTGIDFAGTAAGAAAGKNNPRIFRSADGRAAFWAGVIDDLWRLGKPRGHGWLWRGETVAAGAVSDPFLCGFYDERTLEISHTGTLPVTFDLEIDPTGDGDWLRYKALTVLAATPLTFQFPPAFHARWLRLRATGGATAAVSAQLTFE
ncbi:MAG: hypothetical protein LBR07_10715 [Puniceicoccales bacterium]|jgi:hypothetical protein|nr:hypothetical protein [Puniceicoccales bacterium]